jgi:protein TonB
MHGGGGRVTAPVIVHSQAFSFHAGPNSSQAEVADRPPAIDVGFGDPGINSRSIVGSFAPLMPTVAHHQQNVRTSVMMEGNLIHKVEPQYPAMAKQLHVEGSVIIQAWISREGLIERAQVVSGHPLLVRAALEAVRQWRYRPYYLNHEPVEVETEITVNFTMQR